MNFNKLKYTGELEIAQITIVVSFNISYGDMKPHITELAGLFAHGLDVNTSQVRKWLVDSMSICCIILYLISSDNFNEVKKFFIKNIYVNNMASFGC